MEKTGPIVKEITVNAPAGKVWQALTDKDKMKGWYFDIESFKPEVGFEFRFYGGDENKQYLHLCKVMEVVPGKKLAYSWRYENDPGDSLVTFELFEEQGRTRLRLTHTGVETFTSDPAFARENFVEGWNHIIGTELKTFVERE